MDRRHLAPLTYGLCGDAEMNGLLALASKAFDVPIALVMLAHEPSSWLKAPADFDLAWIERTKVRFEGPVAPNQVYVGTIEAGYDRQPGQVRSYAAVPLTLESGTVVGTLMIADIKPRQFSAEQNQLLMELARVAGVLLRTGQSGETASRLADELAAKALLLQQEHDSVKRYKKMYDRSSALAKLGVWECDLRTEELTWTDGVYDIFEMPRGSALSRKVVVDRYDRTSRLEMEKLRSKIIAEGGSFSIDVRIRTSKGHARWVRLSAEAENENGSPVRIFGLKQDITSQKELWDRMRHLAECDQLTSLANRSRFEAILAESLLAKSRSRTVVALLLVDLDGFKAVNDSFGHATGDECLRQIAKRLRRTFKRARCVARIGGDEFAILLSAPPDRDKFLRIVQAAMAEIKQPIAWNGQSFQVGASIGIAMPSDTRRYDSSRIFLEADSALYAAKRAGRDTFVVFDVKSHGSQASIRPNPCLQ